MIQLLVKHSFVAAEFFGVEEFFVEGELFFDIEVTGFLEDFFCPVIDKFGTEMGEFTTT